MRSHQELFAAVRQHTGMYLPEDTYAAAAAFVQGYNLAGEGQLLGGFREWLVLRLKRGTNLHWYALVLDVAFPAAQSPDDAVSASPETERHAINTLFNLLAEFDVVRSKPNSVSEILAQYKSL